MKNPIKSYSFWTKIIGAALLITLGVWLLIDINTGEKFATFIVLMFTGLVAGIYAIIRAIPLMRTLKSRLGRFVCIIEIIIHIGLSVAMVFAAITKISNEESKFADFVYSNYHFAIAFFFYTRVISYLICTILCKEETDKIKFWVHIGLLTLTCVLCAIPFEGKTIAWIISIIALCCSAFLVIEGGTSYNRYRKEIAKDREIKKEEKEQALDNELDMPTADDLIIPMIDEETDTNNINVN